MNIIEIDNEKNPTEVTIDIQTQHYALPIVRHKISLDNIHHSIFLMQDAEKYHVMLFSNVPNKLDVKKNSVWKISRDEYARLRWFFENPMASLKPFIQSMQELPRRSIINPIMELTV